MSRAVVPQTTPLHQVIMAQSNDVLRETISLLFSERDIRTHGITRDLFEMIDQEIVPNIFRLRTLVKQNQLQLVHLFHQIDELGNTPFEIALLSGNADCVKIFLAAGAPITNRAYELANNWPYTLATLRLYEIADTHQGLIQGKPFFIQAFLESLFKGDLLAEARNNNNYAFLTVSIEAEIFTSAEIAAIVQQGTAEHSQYLLNILADLAPELDGGSLFYFLQEVLDSLSPPPQTLLFSNLLQQTLLFPGTTTQPPLDKNYRKSA